MIDATSPLDPNTELRECDQQRAQLQREVEEARRALQTQRLEHDNALRDLADTQHCLLQSQKLEAIGQLAAGVAHEINTPIQYVSDNVTFLKRSIDLLLGLLDASLPLVESARASGAAPELLAAYDHALKRARLEFLRRQMPGALEQTIDGLQRVIVIVAAMKQLSHPSLAEREPVKLPDLIRAAVTIARNEWKYLADVDLDLDEELPPVPCFSGEISQMLLNLIVNAAHAIGEAATADPGRPRGRIGISLRRSGRWAEIRISDTGCGIPDPIRSRVFDPFFTTKAVGKGTGQGLALAHAAVVDKHQGEIRFTTETGKGTTFIVRLPIDAPPGSGDAA